MSTSRHVGPAPPPSIVVVGSINLDIILELPRSPRRGESRLARRVTIGAGGKGANQAAQAALLGVDTHLIGRVGDDEFGSRVLGALERASVRVDGVRRSEATGLGIVMTDRHGGNWIAVAPRANSDLSPADVSRSEAQIADAAVLVTQLEIPLPVAAHAVKLAARHGVPTVVNPSPARRLTAGMLRRISVLVPNRTEAESLAGVSIRSPSAAIAAAHRLRALGPERVVITLGDQGAVLVGSNEELVVPPIAARSVDPTGAGDAFCGALAVAIAEERPWLEAMRFATAAASLCIRHEGAMAALANRSAVNALLAATT